MQCVHPGKKPTPEFDLYQSQMKYWNFFNKKVLCQLQFKQIFPQYLWFKNNPDIFV